MVAVALVAGGCQDAPAPVAAPPSPTPSPSPTAPPRQPVVGTVEVVTTDTSRNERLGLEEDGDPAPGSVAAATDAVATSLDTWLEGAQADAPDLDTLAASWLVEQDPAGAEVLRSGITNADNPVRAAAYALDVHLEPDPTIVVAGVTVTRHDGSDVALELVLDVTGPRPALLVVGSPGGA